MARIVVRDEKRGTAEDRAPEEQVIPGPSPQDREGAQEGRAW